MWRWVAAFAARRRKRCQSKCARCSAEFLWPTHPCPLPARSWEASTLGNWFAGLLARHEQLHKW